MSSELSKSESRSFISEVLLGHALVADVDSWIATWHDAPPNSDTAGVALHDYLGMTWDEYRLFVEQPTSLRFTIAAHRAGQPIEVVLGDARLAGAAARSERTDEADQVLQWLIDTGRVKSEKRGF